VAQLFSLGIQAHDYFMKIIFYLVAIVIGFFGILGVSSLLNQAGLSPLQFLIPAALIFLAFFIFRKARARRG
jgi:uncharacterized membrane protein